MIPHPSRGTVAFSLENEIYAVEELVGLLFRNARAQAEVMARQNVTDCVLTVGFTLHEFLQA